MMRRGEEGEKERGRRKRERREKKRREKKKEKGEKERGGQKGVSVPFTCSRGHHGLIPSLASFPGHSQILSCSCADFCPQLQDKIWEGPGNEASTSSHHSKKA